MAAIVIIGAGGHARETVEILRSGGSPGDEPAGFLDDRPDLHGSVLDGLPVLGPVEWLSGAPSGTKVLCAVGAPSIARRLVERARRFDASFASAVSPRATVSPRAALGAGVIVFPNVFVSTRAVIGDHVTLNVGSSVSHDSVVGTFANLNPGARVAGDVSLGEECYVGMGACVIQGLAVGARATIGAGAVVIEDVPEDVTVVGVPARPIRDPQASARAAGREGVVGR